METRILRVRTARTNLHRKSSEQINYTYRHTRATYFQRKRMCLLLLTRPMHVTKKKMFNIADTSVENVNFLQSSAYNTVPLISIFYIDGNLCRETLRTLSIYCYLY